MNQEPLSLNQLFATLANGYSTEQKMPVMFVGHGNPMNAIEQNAFTETWQKLGQALPRPKAILTVSAHWLTHGHSFACRVKQPDTIHDFHGFPDILYQQSYPCSGEPELAAYSAKLSNQSITETDDWGLDHGSWSVLMQMFPLADIPVYQISIDYKKPPSFHYQLAKQLRGLRDKGVLIIASGNVVHNLQKVNWSNPTPYDWASEFNQVVKKAVTERDDQKLVAFDKFGELGKLAHPSYDHYLPLLYSLGLRLPTDEVGFFNDGFDLGSISMLSWMYLPASQNINHL